VRWVVFSHVIAHLPLSASLKDLKSRLTLYRMVMPIGTPFLKEKINN